MLNYYNGMPKLKVYDQDSADGLICVFDGNVSKEKCKVVHLVKVLTRIWFGFAIIFKTKNKTTSI